MSVTQVSTPIDVHGRGKPIRDWFPNCHRNMTDLIPHRDRDEVKPYYMCSISDHYLVMLDYKNYERPNREEAFHTLIELSISQIPEDYDLRRIFYGQLRCTKEINRFSFDGEYTDERSQLLQEMLLRAFAHKNVCRCFQNIRQADPDVYFSRKRLGTLESIITKLIIQSSQGVLFN